MYFKKSFLIILSIFIGILTPVFPEELNPKDYLASPFARVTTNMLGYNLIAKSVAQRIIKKELGKEIKGDYKVKIGSFSGIDLKKGIFKSLSIKGKKLCVCGDFHISELLVKTTSEFNYVDYSKKSVQLLTDIPMDYSIVISEEDFNKSFKIEFLNVFSQALPFVSFKKVQFKFEQDKLVITSGINLPFGKNIKISFASHLKVVDGKIILSDCETTAKGKDFADSLVKIINHYNFLDDINRGLFNEVNTKVSVKNVKIIDGKLTVDGSIVLNKG